MHEWRRLPTHPPDLSGRPHCLASASRRSFTLKPLPSHSAVWGSSPCTVARSRCSSSSARSNCSSRYIIRTLSSALPSRRLSRICSWGTGPLAAERSFCNSLRICVRVVETAHGSVHTQAQKLPRCSVCLLPVLLPSPLAPLVRLPHPSGEQVPHNVPPVGLDWAS